MSTGAKIEVPFSSRKEYFIDSGGYPDTVVPYLEGIVEEVKERAEKKYENPDENWTEQLRLEFDDRSNGYYSELATYNGEIVSYEYKIEEDGNILHKKSGEDEWEDN
jgi:hypothetical protein